MIDQICQNSVLNDAIRFLYFIIRRTLIFYAVHVPRHFLSDTFTLSKMTNFRKDIARLSLFLFVRFLYFNFILIVMTHGTTYANSSDNLIISNKL